MYTPKTFICFCTSVRCHIYAKRSPIANFPCQSDAAARSFQSLSPVIRGHMFPRRDGLLARWCQCPSVTPFTFLTFSPPIRLSVCLWGTRGASQSTLLNGAHKHRCACITPVDRKSLEAMKAWRDWAESIHTSAAYSGQHLAERGPALQQCVNRLPRSHKAHVWCLRVYFPGFTDYEDLVKCI